MIQITQEQCDTVIDTVNGYDMTYGDYLDNTEQPFEIVG